MAPRFPPRSVGRYIVTREIGRGGVAVIYLARDRRSGCAVAIKELVVAAEDERQRERFAREARIAAALHHPNIVAVYDLVEGERTPFIAMEYLERGSLRSFMRHLDAPQVLGAIDGMLAALAYAHACGVVHRDLKPENVLVTADGQVKVADFGLARAVDELGGRMTNTAMGTPAYMAPEQAVAGVIGPWTDLYALGVVAFELFAGRLPFEDAGSPVEMIGRHLTVPPPSLRELAPDVDPELAALVERLLAKAPEDRPQSAAQVRAEFARIARTRVGRRWRRRAAIGRHPRARAARALMAAVITAVVATTGAIVLPNGTDERPARPPRGALVAEVAVGRSGDKLPLAAVDARTVWVTNYLDDTVSQIDARTRREMGPRIRVGRHPSDIAVGGQVWVLNDKDGTVSVIDPQRGNVVGEPIRVGSNPAAVALSRGYAWVTLFNADAVRPIAIPGRHAVARAIRVGDRPNGITAAAGSVWVANYGNGTLSRIDPARHRVVGRPIRTGRGPTDATSGGGAVWVANSGEATVARIDPTSADREATVAVGGRPSCVAFAAGRLWATVDDELVEIDPGTNRVAARHALGGADNCVRSGAGGLWVTLRGADAVAQIRL